MAVNKDALVRYKILDACFRNTGRKYSAKDLIEECNKALQEIYPNGNGISRRQLYYDIAFMESTEGWGIELNRIRDGNKIFLSYTDPSFSINNMPLNELEISHLKTAIEILSQFKGMPQFEFVHELLPKLKQGIDSEAAKLTIIDFDANPYLKGIDFLGVLHAAILYKKVLNILYHPFTEENPSLLEIHPYYLKQYNNRWFLLGYNPEQDKYDWKIALDRVIEIKETDIGFIENHCIIWQDYFDDIIGVTKPEGAEAESVVLHFYDLTGRYIETKPIHGSQKAKWIDNRTLEVKLELIINLEFINLILSYSDNVKVIHPNNLLKQVLEKLENARKMYV